MRHKLQISSDTAVSSEAVLLELGIDSLVAVDLRAWFVTELGVDMPILKILGGASIGDLVTDAISRLPVTLLAAVPVEVKEEDAKATQAVLVPNGLGGHDLVPVAPVQESATEKSDQTVLEAEKEVEVPMTSLGYQGHSKNLSLASTLSGNSSSEQDSLSQPHSPALSDTSSVPDHEGLSQIPKSSLDFVTDDTT